MHVHRLTSHAVVALALVPLAGCGAQEAEVKPAAARGAAASLIAAGEIPAPKGKAILKITGARDADGKRKVVKLDIATLEKLPLIEGEIREPFIKRDVRFRGVRIEDLLRIAGVPGTQTRIYMHALDDYHVEFDRQELVSGEAVLVTKVDGKTIPIADGGPIRVMFLGSNDIARNTDLWIWSVDLIKASS